MPREKARFPGQILLLAMLSCFAGCNAGSPISVEEGACRLALDPPTPLDESQASSRPCTRRAPPVGVASAQPTTETEDTDREQELDEEEPHLGGTSASCRESFERALFSVRQSSELDRVAPEVLLATVPDPIDSGLASAHASAVEAVIFGAERAGYARDVSWMPWSSSGQHACRTMEPGVLVLRRRHDSTRGEETRSPWLVVFIVGETPTFGVHPLAFHRAIRSAEAFRGWQPLTLIGPYFTGAASSIRHGLCATGRTGDDARLVTGSATGDDLDTILAPYPLHRLTARDSELEQFFFRYPVDVQNVSVATEGMEAGILPGVAILRESGSGWGAATSDIESRYGERSNDALHPELQLIFPMRIAALRREYAKLEKRQREESANPGAPLDLAEPSIPLEFDERARIPSAPYEPTPQLISAMDISLRRLLAQVAHARVQYIGIEATDTADSIFLTRRLRELAPDARVFLLSSDILYSRHDKPVTLTGAYVVSSYPFLGVHDFWNGDPERRYDAFANDSAEGIYNAVTFALSAPCSAAREIGFCDSSRRAAVRAAAPTAVHSRDIEELPLWLGVLGMNGFEPIWFRDTAPPSEARTCLEIDPRVMPPNTWHLVIFLTGFGVAVDRRRLASHLRHLETTPSAPNIKAAHRDLAGYIAGRRAAGWMALVWMSTMHIGAISATYRSGYYRLGLATGVLLASWAIASFDLWPRPRAFRVEEFAEPLPPRLVLPRAFFAWWNSRAPRGGRGLFAWSRDLAGLGRPAVFLGLLGLLALGLGIWTVTVHPLTESAYHSGRLFSLRTLSIFSGVSPGTPIVLSLLTTWLLLATRVALVSDFLTMYACIRGEDRHGGPLSNLLLTREGIIDTSVDRAETALFHVIVPRVGTQGLGALLLLFAIPAFALAIKNPSTLENEWGRLALLLPMVVLGAMIASLAVEFAAYSSSLRRLLHLLLLRPVAAFLHLIPLPLASSVDRMLSMGGDDRMKLSVILTDWRAYIATHPAIPNAPLPHPHAPECVLLELISRLNSTLDEEIFPQAPRPRAVRNGTRSDEPRAFYRPLRSAREEAPDAESPAPIHEEERAEDKNNEGVLVASFSAVIVARYVRLLRHYMACLTATGLGLLATVSSYPFQPRQLFSLGAWIVMGSVSIACITVFLSFDRSTLLSRISRTTPGRLTFNGAFALRIFTYVVIPLFSLFASQTPQVMHAIYRAVEPFLRVIG